MTVNVTITAGLVLGSLTALALTTGCATTGTPPRHAHRTATRGPTTAAPTPHSTAGLDAMLPLSQQELQTATRLAARFTAAQASYRYNQPPQTYLARLRPMVTGEFYGELARSALAPGLLSTRRRHHVIATAQATPAKIRMLASGSVIALVGVHQHVTATTGQYDHHEWRAVTVIKTSRGWKTSDAQPANSGDAGGTNNAS